MCERRILAALYRGDCAYPSLSHVGVLPKQPFENEESRVKGHADSNDLAASIISPFLLEDNYLADFLADKEAQLNQFPEIEVMALKKG